MSVRAFIKVLIQDMDGENFFAFKLFAAELAHVKSELLRGCNHGRITWNITRNYDKRTALPFFLWRFFRLPAPPVGQHEVPEHDKNHARHRIEYRGYQQSLYDCYCAKDCRDCQQFNKFRVYYSTPPPFYGAISVISLLRSLAAQRAQLEKISPDTKSTNCRRFYL